MDVTRWTMLSDRSTGFVPLGLCVAARRDR